jgi:apolipoprotein D and lipocalin family protein
MRKLAFALAILLPVMALAGPVRDLSQPMRVVGGYDKARLVGEWFEVAQSDSWLQVDCHAVTTSIETRDDSRLTLKIACHKGSVTGKVVPIEGVLAETAPGVYQLRLVRLAQMGNVELAVLWAAPDDSMVVLGSPLGQVGWVLAKVAHPSEAEVAVGVQALVDNGYNPRAISPVEQ